MDRSMTDNLPTWPGDGPRAVGSPAAGGGLTARPPAEAGGAGGGFDLRRFAYSFWRFRWLVAGILVVAVAASVLVYRTLQPDYKAASTIWIQSNDHRNGPIRSEELLQSYAWVDLINSFTVLEPVIHDLRLYVQPLSRGAAGALADLEVEEGYRSGTYQ